MIRLRATVCWVLCAALPQFDAAAVPLLGAHHISAGNFTTCAVGAADVRCWGVNVLGEVAYNETLYGYFYQSSVPVLLPGLSAVSRVAIGGQHACSLSNGAVACWGDNNFGQSGPNGGLLPALVDGASSGVSAVAAGGLDTCAIIDNGAWCWGDNYFGQLGSDAIVTGQYDATSATPVPVTGLQSGVTKIVVGTTAFPSQGEAGHACAIASGVVECWGDNRRGQLGRDTVPALSYSAMASAVAGLSSPATDIATGETHSCAVVSGAAWCWGSNFTGELGSDSVAVGSSSFSQTPVAVHGLGSGVVAISASSYHTCAIVSNDAVHPVKCWGANRYGQLGNGTATNSPVPVDVAFFPALGAANQVTEIAAGGQHTCAIIVTAGVSRTYCWGDNEAGELGADDAPMANPVPGLVAGISSNVTGIGAGSGSHECAVVNSGAQCWGANQSGQLGDGLLVDRSVAGAVNGLTTGVSQIAEGGDFTCAVVDGAAKCWGGGYHGVLGNNSQNRQPAPVQVSGLTANVTRIAAAGVVPAISSSGGGASFGGHACAVVSGAVQCWGDNFSGALGNESVAINAYSTVPVTATGITAATEVAVGQATSCAIVSGGVQCWGQWVGNLAFPSGSATPVAVTGMDSGVTALAAGISHVCALQGGVVKCWGYNYFGNLGNGDSSGQPSIEPVTVIGLSDVTLLVAGGNHTCAAASDGVRCWGSNLYSELGTSAYPYNCNGVCSSTPVLIAGLSSGIVALGAGWAHTCAQVATSAIKCWGDDFFGELGAARLLTAETPLSVILGDAVFRNGFEL